MSILNPAGDWFEIGQEMPVVDANNRRPAVDENGDLRPTEIVLHERLNGLQLRIDGSASAKTRRWVLATLDFLSRPQSYAAIEATSWENAFLTITQRTVTGVRDHETGTELPEEKRRDFFENHVEWEDVLPILYTVKRGLELSRSKKKGWSLLFDSPTGPGNPGN